MTLPTDSGPAGTRRIAVVGSGISGLSAAWLLSFEHDVTLFEAGATLGGHTNTVDVEVPDASGRTRPLAVDTGFIVFNDRNYPNLSALFEHLEVTWHPSNMTFSVSVDDGRLEYAGNGLGNVFAQRTNVFRPSFWRLIANIARFYRETGALDTAALDDATTLGDYLHQNGYPSAFVDGHLLPMVAAIWSCPAATAREYPLRSFLQFAQNHGLVQFRDRPNWLTVTGGARHYVEAMARTVGRVETGTPVRRLRRDPAGVSVVTDRGQTERFDDVVVASHADQALAMLEQPTADEARLLGAFRYTVNRAYLHSDPLLMPKRRAAWAAWNYLERSREDRERALFCSYWMNRLQGLETRDPLVVTLNPPTPPAPGTVLREMTYTHPVFDRGTQAAQARLWGLQGRDRIWFAGSYFGAGFHEDGLQAGLAVAEAIGGRRRPWQVPDPSGRIRVFEPAAARPAA